MPSQTDIANGAMAKLGQRALTALSDNSKEARWANNRFDHARKTLLRMHHWNFCMKRVKLSPISGETPSFGYTYFFQLPADCLKVVQVGELGSDYKIEQNKIASDEDTIELRYVADNPTCGLFSEEAAEALSCYLAWDLCEVLTGSTNLKDGLWQYFNQAFKKAQHSDSSEEPGPEFVSSLLLDSRISPVGGTSVYNTDPGV